MFSEEFKGTRMDEGALHTFMLFLTLNAPYTFSERKRVESDM